MGYKKNIAICKSNSRSNMESIRNIIFYIICIMVINHVTSN